jgi:hypothetical protein
VASSRIEHPIRGLGVRDRRMTYALRSTSDTSVTQAGPRCGSAVPSNARSALVVQLSGEQSEDWTVHVLDAGLPSLAATGVRVGYRKTTEATSQVRAWQAPSQLLGWVAGEYEAAATKTFGAIDAAVIPSSQKLICTYIQTTGTSPDPIYARTFNPFTNEWGAAVALPGTSTATQQLTAVCVLPGSERILAFVTDDSLGTGAFSSRHIYYSDNEGATWGAYSKDVLDTPPSSAYTGIRCRLLVLPDASLMLFLVVDTGSGLRAYQYGSNNLGASFTTVAAWDLIGSGSAADVTVLADGRIGMLAVNASGYPTWRVVGSAYESLDDADVTVIVSAVYAEMTTCVDYDGIWYVFARKGVATDEVSVFRSINNGESWTDLQQVFHSGATGDYPTRMTAAPAAGSILLVHQWVATTGDEDSSIAVAICGGWSSITSRAETSTFGGSGATWVPFEKPGDMGWTMSGGGTDTLVAGGWCEIVTAGNTRYSTDPPVAVDTATAIEAIFDGAIVAGGSLTTSDIAIEIGPANGTYDSQIRLRFTADEIKVTDVVDGTDLITYEPTSDLTTPFQIKVGVTAEASPTLHVAIRRPTERAWTEIYDGAITNNGGAPSATGHFRWGHMAAANATSRWRLVAYTIGSTLIPQWRSMGAATSSYQTFRNSKILTARPYPLGDTATAGATFISAVDGPGAIGDTYAIPRAYDHPISNLFGEVAPSPRSVWRSTGETEQTFGWSLAGGAETALLSTTHVLAVLGANFRTIYWEGYTGGAWSTLGTLDLASGMSGLTFARTGDRIVIDTGSASATRYIWRNELVSTHVDLGGGIHRKIVANSEGILAPSSTAGRKVELRIELLGSEPASGTASIYHHSGVLVVHNVGTHSRYRWRIPAQTTCEGYFQAGHIQPYALASFGVEYGWGRTVEVTPNAETWRDDAGTLYARSRGAAPRRWVVSWQNGVPQQRIVRASPPTPDYISAKANYPAIATYQDVPYLLAGLVDELAQGEEPCIALARVPDASAADTHVITDPRLFLYGRLTSPITLDTSLGDEGTGEAIRVQQTTVEGIV